LKEAEWAWSEMQDFVRQIQRYRLLLITGIFAVVGWTLGQALGASGGQVSSAQGLLVLRRRTDLAVIVFLLPVLTLAYGVLMVEAVEHVRSLARYRFLLGVRLGRGEPVWRWEIWRDEPEGSWRTISTLANVSAAAAVLALLVFALWFVKPAVDVNQALWPYWFASSVVTTALFVSLAVFGIQRARTGDVGAPLTLNYEDLWPRPKDRQRPEPNHRQHGPSGGPSGTDQPAVTEQTAPLPVEKPGVRETEPLEKKRTDG
jgi:hypothetical protein